MDIDKYIHVKSWDVINNPNETTDVTTYPCPDLHELIYASKGAPRMEIIAATFCIVLCYRPLLLTYFNSS